MVSKLHSTADSPQHTVKTLTQGRGKGEDGDCERRKKDIRMQHFDQNKEDFGLFCQNATVSYFLIRIRK
jgi:hypothetical protein